ncbi:uncharacterized protein K02A2.6-like [Anopheles merus]|uniref:uncharacterized protein K02A2.6-like n=1 Tax=Anopheles merus TaxID=30066 RepID=UPI001BE4465E|nr:uncharacterized protein K02A2.6-like [Anopheles merus]
MSSPEETPIIEEQRRLSQNGVLNTGFIHPQPPQHTPSDSSPLQQTLQLLQQQLAQQQQQMAQQQQLLSQLVQQQQQQQPPTPDLQFVPKPSNPELILEALAGNISEFRYDPEAGVTFESWYTRFNEMVEKLTVLFGKMESVLSKRFKCLNITKTRTEDLLAFTCRVNKACVDAEFSSMTEEDFKCLILVCGLKDESVQEIRMKLLAAIEDRKNATLEQLAADCQRLVRVKADSAMIATDTSERVQAVQARNNRQWHRNTNNERYPKPAPRNEASKPRTLCWLCGAANVLHWTRDCTYRTNKCRDCGRTGHREGFCNSSQRRRGRPRFDHRRAVSSRVVRVNVCSVQQKRKFVSIPIGEKPARLQLDTGSDITVINQQLWKQLGKPHLNPPKVRAKAATGEVFGLQGEFEANVSINNTTKQATIRVSKADVSLFGADLIHLFGLGTVPMDSYCNHIATAEPRSWEKEFPSLFSGTGLCTKAQIHLELQQGSRPVFRPKRPVAYAMEDAVNKELDRLENLGIISSCDYSDWAAPVVVVRKANGKIRLCGDYSTGLNAALHPHEYPLPLPQDIFSKLARCVIFSQIDLSDAFLQVEIEAKSRPLLTINTHRGLYHYNRLPPGIKVAPGAFQQIMDKMLAGVNGVSAYMDDVIVGGKTQEEHDAALEETLKRIRDYGFTIRSEKCAFNKSEIRYLGHIIDSRGLRPDPAKIDAIKNLPAPKDVTGVRSSIGAINFYAKFIPNMRNLRYPLDKLLLAGSVFQWTPECQKAFDQFKALLSTELLLTHYDPTRDIVVSADASSVGLGATLCHKYPDGSLKVVQHASRALSKAEIGYSQIDREGLAIIFAVTKFHPMIYGRHFTLQTDHRPLVRIFGSKKGIPTYTANRLQRFALTLQLYDMDIEYVATGSFGNADVLSRLIHHHAKPEAEYVIASLELENDLRSVAINALSSFPLCFRDVETATQTDPLLRKVHKYVQDGWPHDVSFGADLAR